MKRLIAIALTTVATLGATAQSADFLTFRQTDGTEQSLPAVGTCITFANGNLHAANGRQVVTFPLVRADKLFFSATATGIGKAPTATGFDVDADIVAGRLHVTAPAGTPVTLLTADGRRLPANATLAAGLYVVRVGSRTFKLIAQ